jgi:hypothetical protein
MNVMPAKLSGSCPTEVAMPVSGFTVPRYRLLDVRRIAQSAPVTGSVASPLIPFTALPASVTGTLDMIRPVAGSSWWSEFVCASAPRSIPPANASPLRFPPGAGIAPIRVALPPSVVSKSVLS